MSEIADELERLAKSIEQEANVVVRESAAGTFASGHGFGMRAAAVKLRQRAAELRTPIPPVVPPTA
jgi:hypothetical protein